MMIDECFMMKACPFRFHKELGKGRKIGFSEGLIFYLGKYRTGWLTIAR